MPVVPALLGRPEGALCAVVGLAALLLYLLTAAPSITWRNGGIDSGELATAVATGSVAHPPGYPTYLLLGRAAALLPVEPARALAWLSAGAAALACAATVAGAARTASLPRGRLGLLAAAAPGLWLATSPLLWASATYAEVNAPAAAVAALWLALGGWRPRRALSLFAAGAALGAALGIHALILFLIAGTAAGQLGAPRWWRRLGALAAGSALGAGVVFATLALYPPAGPANWYAPQTREGWLLLVGGAAYRGLFTLQDAPLRLAVTLRSLVVNLGVVGALAAVAGVQEVLTRAVRRRVDGTLRCAGLALVYVAFVALYGARDADAYLLPALVLLAPAVASGVAGAAALLAAFRVLSVLSRARLRDGLLVVLVAGPVVVQAARLMGELNLRHDHAAVAYAERVLDDAPPRAVILAAGDAATFALWYARYARGRRPDVAVLNEDLLYFDWYRAHAAALHGDVAIPPWHERVELDASPAALVARANPGRVIHAPAPPIAPETGRGT